MPWASYIHEACNLLSAASCVLTVMCSTRQTVSLVGELKNKKKILADFSIQCEQGLLATLCVFLDGYKSTQGLSPDTKKAYKCSIYVCVGFSYAYACPHHLYRESIY